MFVLKINFQFDQGNYFRSGSFFICCSN